VIGDFVWTAFDYLGEASIGWAGYIKSWLGIGPYPWHLAYCGEIDATGLLRPNAYYREVLWKTGKHPISAFVKWPDPAGSLPDGTREGVHRNWVLPDVHPSWNFAGYEGKPLEVEVYSELPEVELTLNGKSLGRKAITIDTKYSATFTVPYEAGVLEAIGYRNGKKVATWKLETAGNPANVVVGADRSKLKADGIDLAYVAIQLVDAKGRPIYDTRDDRDVTFAVTGKGVLAGAGSGNPYGTPSFQSGTLKTFHGRAVAAVRATRDPANITVRIVTKGLPLKTVKLTSIKSRAKTSP
jgi:beta-galactosidase